MTPGHFKFQKGRNRLRPGIRYTIHMPLFLREYQECVATSLFGHVNCSNLISPKTMGEFTVHEPGGFMTCKAKCGSHF